ncbi:MAG TPA: hypothetical protein ENJ38_08785 [Rhodospirillales bacterium]|nr:hypothetical protein [Rhodospirillales bacterium]
MGGISTLASLGLNAALQREAQKRADRNLRKEEERRRKELLRRFEAQTRRTDEALRRRLAAERARAGAAGIATGGSFDAILRGLQSEAERRRKEQRDALALDLAALGDSFGTRRRRNLLERGTGLLGLGRRIFAGFGSRRSLLG